MQLPRPTTSTAQSANKNKKTPKITERSRTAKGSESLLERPYRKLTEGAGTRGRDLADLAPPVWSPCRARSGIPLGAFESGSALPSRFPLARRWVRAGRGAVGAGSVGAEISGAGLEGVLRARWRWRGRGEVSRLGVEGERKKAGGGASRRDYFLCFPRGLAHFRSRKMLGGPCVFHV
jgi:hypothetical protein